MTVRISVTVKGLEDVRRRVRGMTDANMQRALQKGLNNAARQIVTAAKQRAPYGSGALRRSGYYRASPAPGVARAEAVFPPIGGKPIAVWQHEGTGIYGPRGAPITPVKADALRWETTYGKGFVRISKSGRARRPESHVQFAKSVKGVRPNPFLLDAFESAIAAGVIRKELAASVNAVLHATVGEGDEEGGRDA